MGAGVQYKILFVGLGSIGQKHLRNLRLLGEFAIDAIRTKNEPFDGIDNIYTDYDQIPNDYDITFITNPTYLHSQAINKLSNKTKNMFIEKPIFDRIQDCKFSSGINYVACPLRYSQAVQNLKQYVENNNVYSFRAICSSYLPNWRKGVDYTKCYSADSSKGGGVELDIIHEIDYIKWVFGDFDKVQRISGKKSHLEIKANDIALYLFENKNVLGSLHLDYFGRDTKREIEVFAQNETVKFNILEGCENMYIDEMKYFLDLVKMQPIKYYNGVEEAKESLRMAIL